MVGQVKNDYLKAKDNQDRDEYVAQCSDVAYCEQVGQERFTIFEDFFP